MKHNLELNREYFRKNFLLVLFCLVLSACGGDDFSDLDQKLAEIKARPKDKIAPLPPVKMTEPFSFDLEGRDPFQPEEKEEAVEIDAGEGSGIRPDPNRIKEDLESFGIDTLRMVGTLKKDETFWGLVQSSSNKTVYKVKAGNYMGLNDGKIIEVSDKEIKLMEIIPDKSADKEKPRWNEQATTLKLVPTVTK